MFGLFSKARLLATAGFVGLLCSQPAFALTFYVGGSESGCTHHTLQDAIDDLPDNAASDIHVANSATYTQVALTVDDKNVHIIGGYALCGDATASSTGTGRAVRAPVARFLVQPSRSDASPSGYMRKRTTRPPARHRTPNPSRR